MESTIEITPFKRKDKKTVWLPKWQLRILNKMPNASQYIESLLKLQPEFKDSKAALVK